MRKTMMAIFTLCLSTTLALPASALDCVSANSISLGSPQAASLTYSAALPSPTKSYDFAGTLIDAPGDPEYGKPTSIEVVHTADGGAKKNEDVSKNAAMIPPGFGTPSADTRGTGTYLTPNLAPGGAPVPGAVINGSGSAVITPGTQLPGDSRPSASTGFTQVTDDLYYSGGHLGTLKIPAIDLSVKIYEGTGSSTLKKGE